jgi:hypothetical protein
MSNTISKSDDVCVVNSNTIGAVSGTGSAHPSGATDVSRFWVVQSLVACVVCRIIGYDRIVITTNATCLRSILTQIVVSAEQV